MCNDLLSYTRVSVVLSGQNGAAPWSCWHDGRTSGVYKLVSCTSVGAPCSRRKAHVTQCIEVCPCIFFQDWACLGVPGRGTGTAYPALLTDVAPVKMSRTMSLPEPEFWLVKLSVVKLLPTTTSLLAEEEMARNGPASAMMMTSPAVLFAAIHFMCKPMLCNAFVSWSVHEDYERP